MENKVPLQLCRLCLMSEEIDDENSMLDLFKEIETKCGSKFKLCNKVEIFLNGIHLHENENMPTKMCLKCFKFMQLWFSFRNLCENVQIYLEESLLEKQNFNTKIGVEQHQNLISILNHAANSGTKIPKNNLDSNDKTYSDDHDDDDDNASSFKGKRKVETTPHANDKMDHTALLERNLATDNSDKTTTRERLKNIIKRNSRRNGHKPTNVGEIDNRHLNDKKIKRASRTQTPTTFMCSVCGNVYTKKSAFNYHMIQHDDLKPHECEICGKRCRQACELKNHMRRHTGERPFQCSYCDRYFIDRSEKHRHERVHTNTRPYKCTECGKSFAYSATLNNHIKLHTGRKDHNCLICQKSFTLRHQLKSHLMTFSHRQKESQTALETVESVFV